MPADHAPRPLPLWGKVQPLGPWHRIERDGNRIILLCSGRRFHPRDVLATSDEPMGVVCSAGRMRGFCARAGRALLTKEDRRVRI